MKIHTRMYFAAAGNIASGTSSKPRSWLDGDFAPRSERELHAARPGAHHVTKMNLENTQENCSAMRRAKKSIRSCGEKNIVLQSQKMFQTIFQKTKSRPIYLLAFNEQARELFGDISVLVMILM